ncbi:hypothetical protein M758_UG210100 [Ceratodon purpureus]|nr:hypothetical protein M758_UG210100 [Ceratodon purpureus]
MLSKGGGVGGLGWGVADRSRSEKIRSEPTWLREQHAKQGGGWIREWEDSEREGSSWQQAPGKRISERDLKAQQHLKGVAGDEALTAMVMPPSHQ